MVVEGVTYGLPPSEPTTLVGAAVISALLVLPGFTFLLLEAAGLTPNPVTSGPLP
jgi:hypothetical protein